jgi:hypothetical protein
MNENIIQLMTFDEVNTRIDQPMEHDIHRDIQGECHVPWVDHFRYTIKLIMAEGVWGTKSVLIGVKIKFDLMSYNKTVNDFQFR